MKFNFKTLLVICFLTAIQFLSAQKISSFEGKSKEELYNWSIDTNVKEEKQKLRSYLALKFPNTMEGETARAWITSAEGYTDRGIQMYLEVIKKYPKPWLAIINSLDAVNKDNINEIVANYEKMLTEEPSYSNYLGARNLYFTLQKIDEKAAEDKLLFWEAKLGSDIYVFDFIRGIDAETNKDYKLAETYFTSALTKTGGSIQLDLWTRLINLRKDKLFDNENKTVNDQVELYMPLIKEAELHMNKSAIVDKTFASGAFEFIGDFLIDKDNRLAIQMFDSAFKVYPSFNLIDKKMNPMLHMDKSFNDLLDVLVDAEIYLPDNASLQGAIAEKYLVLNNIQSSEKYYKLAIDNSVLLKDKLSYSSDLTISIYDDALFNYEKSELLLKSFLGKTYSDASTYAYLSTNRLKAGDYEKAKEYLLKYNEIYKKQSNYSSSYFDDKLSTITSCQKNKEKLDTYYKDKPFEKQWNSNYKDGLQLYVNFPTNSAVIPASDYPKLKTLAAQITDNGADDYSFLISGHTDNTGSDLINDALSLKRAKSITDYLFTNYKIPFVRMEVNGFGSKQPIDDNLTENGRAKNRRVEISLSANISNPKIAVTTTITEYKTKFSNDGNYFITGNSPLELWDAKQKIKLKIFDDLNFNERQISPNNKYIAGIVSYNKNYFLVIVDFQTGQVLQQQTIGYNEFNNFNICWFKTSTKLVVGGYNGTILLYDVKNSKPIKTYTTGYNPTIALTSDEKYLAIIHKFQNGTLDIVDVKTFEKVITKNVFSWPRGLATSYDGKQIVVCDNNRELFIYNTTNWELKKLKVSTWANDIASHPSKNIFVLNDYAGADHNKVETVDIDKMTTIAIKDIGVFKPIWQFNADGSKIMGYIEDHIEILDPMTLKTIDKIEPTTSNLVETFKDGENQLISVDKESINVWNVKTGTKNHYWLATPVSIRQLDAPDEFLAVNEDRVNSKTLFTQYNSADYSKKELFEIPFQVDKWCIHEGKIIILVKKFLPIYSGNKYGQVLVYDSKSYQLINSFEVLLQDVQLQFNLDSSGFNAYDISPDGSKLSFSVYWQDGFGKSKTFPDFVRIYDLTTGKELKKIINSKYPTFLSNSKINVGDRTYDLYTNTSEIATKEELNINSVVKRKYDGYHSQFDFDDLNLHIETKFDNQFIFSNKTTTETILTLVSKKNNEWIAYAPSGEFASSLNGTDRVNWILGSRRLPFNALKAKFENPNLLKNKLAAVVSNVTPVVTPVVVVKVEPDLFVSPYKMELVSEPFITTKEGNYDVKIKINKDIASLPDATVVFELNGRKLADRGFGVAAVVKSPTEYVITKNIKLQDGTNNLRIYIDYKQTQVEENSLVITKEIVKSVTPLKSTTQLWFFGIGVSKYENPTNNLDFPDRDISEIADLLKKQEGILYQKVNTKVLINENATEKNTRYELNDFLKMASAEDVIIILFAGHGTQDNDQNLYFMTYESDLSKPFTGLDISIVKKFLVNRPPNQKALLWLDVCHAGAISANPLKRGGEKLSTDDAIKQLTEGTGTIVLASSTGKESSLEHETFCGGHGAFSCAIIDALNGEADKKNGDVNGVVSLLEMQSFVSRRVIEITEGQQHPTTPQSQNVQDFPLIKY